MQVTIDSLAASDSALLRQCSHRRTGQWRGTRLSTRLYHQYRAQDEEESSHNSPGEKS